MRILRRKAVSNIIATILIFAMMVVGMGILYSRIGPVAIGFEAESSVTNQEFIFLNIKNELDSLVGSAQGSRSNVRITSEYATYDLNITAPRLRLDLTLGGTTNTLVNDMGLFEAKIDRPFRDVSTSRFLGNNVGETTMINTEMTDHIATGLIYMDIRTTQSTVSLYYRASADLVQFDATTYILNIFTYNLTINPASPISDFPITQDEWTLAMVRGPTTVSNPFNLTSTTETSFSLTQSVSRYTLRAQGQVLDSYTFQIAAGSTVIVNNINVPIYFGI